MPESRLNYNNGESYLLSGGEPVTSLVPFSSPSREYDAAFEDGQAPFLNYYTFKGPDIQKRTLTRGQFLDLAECAAEHLRRLGLSKGDRILHLFSSNSLYDLVFRLASVFTGCVPVTVNWQADDDARIIFKGEITGSKAAVYDSGFALRAENLQKELAGLVFFDAGDIEKDSLHCNRRRVSLDYNNERFVIFTSGTTGKPKGASLSHRSYLTNRLTYEGYFGVDDSAQVDIFLVNPMHHANSTALSDWALRRRGAVLHLLDRYTTPYWEVLTDAVECKRDLFIASMVARHIDFLQSLSDQGGLPVDEGRLKKALSRTDILIGSAPVGPTTIERLIRFAGRVSHIRFGSTETCLQVAAIPVNLPESEVMKAFRTGWSHKYKGEDAPGYYIGRGHDPFTRLRVVKSTQPDDPGYMAPCTAGEPGYLITQGGNLFSGYVGDEKATEDVFQQGWYTGLKDVVFTLNGPDGDEDFYWMSRDSELLIRGGANYAYDQVAGELAGFITETYDLPPESFQLAVVGIRLHSEHEDSCCVTMELPETAADVRDKLEHGFIKQAQGTVSKGAVLYPQLTQEFLYWLKELGKYDGGHLI